MPNEKGGGAHTPRGILEMALKKERSSYAFYDQMLKSARIEMLTEVLEQLRN